jgi:hypothetical protein
MGRLKRRNPYPPIFSVIAARITEPPWRFHVRVRQPRVHRPHRDLHRERHEHREEHQHLRHRERHFLEVEDLEAAVGLLVER